MTELIAHLLGDYCLQSHSMASRKTSSWRWAIIHALFYGLPFLALVDNAAQWAVIVSTHAVIDRYRIASYWVRFWGIGCQGAIWRDPNYREPPPFLAVWLLILVDNTMHLLINHMALRHL